MHQCNYCDYKCTRKYNLKVHQRNKHVEDNTNNLNDLAVPAPPPYAPLPAPAPQPLKKSMVNETLTNNYLRKIKMMLRKNVLLGVDMYTLRRNVDRNIKRNNNNFNSLTQYYEIILNDSEYNELDEDMNQNSGDLFGNYDGEEEKEQTIYKSYV